MTPAQRLTTWHRLRDAHEPHNLAEVITEAALLEIALDVPDPAQGNTTLRQRLTTYWQPAVPTTRPTLPPAHRAPRTQWGAPVE